MHVQSIEENEEVCVGSEVGYQDDTLFLFDELLDTLTEFDQSALFFPQHWATFVSRLLEPWIATITRNKITVAVASVKKVSHSHASLTQPLESDAGCYHFALWKAVAERVSGQQLSLT